MNGASTPILDLANLREAAFRLADDELLRTLARVLLAEPTPSGTEGRLARRLADFVTRYGAPVRWAVQPIPGGGDRANFLTWTGRHDWTESRGVWFYAHLDHSLSGHPELDWPLTAWDEPPGLADHGEYITSLGLAVAKGPALCALAAHLVLSQVVPESCNLDVGVILAAGGTHRARPPGNGVAEVPPGLDRGMGIGVETALATGWRPGAVVNVKGGSDGILNAEPGCLMLQVTWRQPFVALPARGDDPGAAVIAAHLVLALEEWRARYRALSPQGQIGADLGVGALTSGLPYKPDLLPGGARINVYCSTVPGLDVAGAVAELKAHLAARLAEVGAGEGTLNVEIYSHVEPGVTDPGEPIVRSAHAAWRAERGGPPPEVVNYRGSTDGVLFRHRGIPTVRFGPTARPTAADPTVESLSLAELRAFTRMYINTVLEFVAHEGLERA